MRHNVVKVLPYRAEDLFTLVGDVTRYPEFVPWVTRLTASPARADGPEADSLAAEAEVGFSFLKERFATTVRRDRAKLAIEVGLIRGPFRKLSNSWHFTPEGDGTRIDFAIDFEFKSRLLDGVLHANFDRAVGKLIACFEARAAALKAAGAFEGPTAPPQPPV